MEFRTLERGEREALLELLSGWDVGDGWAPGALFRRYLEQDPGFAERNVHVAVDGGRLVSCVQVFPRPVWIRGAEVPLGGIGSVYTDPACRRQGLAEQLLERAVAAMRDDGMLLSLLFATRLDWYARLGWTSRPVERWLLRGAAPGEGVPASEREAGEPFARARDLADVQALHRAYSGVRNGPVARDASLWEASLCNAGNPDERFRVWRCDGRVVAYARTTTLSGVPVLLEVGRADDAAEPLADLVASLVGTLLVAPDLGFDPPLARALAARGVRVQTTRDPMAMWRCLDAPALARHLGLAPAEPDALLDRLLPQGESLYWTADRF